MTMRKIFIRFCKKIESFVMKSINVQGECLFCAGKNFPKWVSVTSRLLEMRLLELEFGLQKIRNLVILCP